MFGESGFPKGWFWDSPYGDATLIAGAAAVAGVAGVVILLAVLGIGMPRKLLSGGVPSLIIGGPARLFFGQPAGPGSAGPGGPVADGPVGTRTGGGSPTAGGPTAAPSGGGPGSPSSTSTVTGGPQPSPSASQGTSTPATPTTTPPTGVPPTTGPSSPSPTTTPGGPTPAPTPSPTQDPTPAPPPSAGTLRVSPGTISVSPLLGNTLTLTASGGPVSWSISEPSSLLGELIVTPSSGSLAAGASTQITITVSGIASLDTTLTASPGGEQVTVLVGALLPAALAGKGHRAQGEHHALRDAIETFLARGVLLGFADRGAAAAAGLSRAPVHLGLPAGSGIPGRHVPGSGLVGVEQPLPELNSGGQVLDFADRDPEGVSCAR